MAAGDKCKTSHQLGTTPDFMQDSETSDVTLICGAKEFFAHKSVLQENSPYFDALFNSKIDDSKSSRIELDDVDPDILHCILNFIYSGSVNISTEQQLMDILSTSSVMGFANLKDHCFNELKKHSPSKQNCLDTKHQSKNNDSKEKDFDPWSKFFQLSIRIDRYLPCVPSSGSCINLVLHLLLTFLVLECWHACQIYVKELSHFINSGDGNLSSVKPTWMSEAFAEATRVKQISLKDSFLPWITDLTYFSEYHYDKNWDHSKNANGIPRIKNTRSVQQFDMTTMTWGPLLIPDTNYFFSWSDTLIYQYRKVFYIAGDRQYHGLNGIYDARKNSFNPTKSPKFSFDTKISFFKGKVYAIEDWPLIESTNTSVFYTNPGSDAWYAATPIDNAIGAPTLLASTKYFFVISNNYDLAQQNDVIIKYNVNPEKGMIWETFKPLQKGLNSSQFFIHNGTLNAIQFSDSNGTLFTFDHSSMTMNVVNMVNWPMDITHSLTLSKFQNPRSPFVFFSNADDHFSIPIYLWEPRNGDWTKLPPPRGKCAIPNHSSVKLVYSNEA